MEGEPNRLARRLETQYVYGPRSETGRAFCHLEVYDNEDSAVVIATELNENIGMSVTNAWEYIAPNVVQDFGIARNNTRWIEHYPERKEVVYGRELTIREYWDEVVLKWNERGEVENLDWRRLTWEEVQEILGRTE